MIAYVVVQNGMYRHDILGPFALLAVAKEEAIERVQAEKDHYHVFEVLKLESGQSPKLIGRAEWEWKPGHGRFIHGHGINPGEQEGKVIWRDKAL